MLSECLVRLKESLLIKLGSWEDGFPTVKVSNLFEGSPDHTLMLIQFIKQPRGKKTLRFFNHWAEQEFNDSVSKVWGTHIQGFTSFQISEKLKLLKPILKDRFQVHYLQALVIHLRIYLMFKMNCICTLVI